MIYQTVFDVTETGYTSGLFDFSDLFMVLIGILFVVFRRQLPAWGGKNSRIINVYAFAFLSFAIVLTLVTFMAMSSKKKSLRQAIESGNTEIVEGLVSQFDPMPHTGYRMERFCVQGTCFEYSDHFVTGGFNNMSSHGGPIREGLPVRVTYIGNKIIKLEIAQQTTR